MRPAILILLLSCALHGQVRPAAFSTTPPAHVTTDKAFWRLVAADIALNSVDVATSLYDFHAIHAGESNPLFGHHPSTARFSVQYAAMSVGYIWLAHRLDKRRPRAARMMLLIDIGIEVDCVQNNIRLMQYVPTPPRLPRG